MVAVIFYFGGCGRYMYSEQFWSKRDLFANFSKKALIGSIKLFFPCKLFSVLAYHCRLCIVPSVLCYSNPSPLPSCLVNFLWCYFPISVLVLSVCAFVSLQDVPVTFWCQELYELVLAAVFTPTLLGVHVGDITTLSSIQCKARPCPDLSLYTYAMNGCK